MADPADAEPWSTSRGACTVAVCRGCCCGSPKITGIDHNGQLADLRHLLAETSARVRITQCLGPCAQGNVVVQPSPHSRGLGAGPVWLGGVNDRGAARVIAEWIRAGGPGTAEMPDALAPSVFVRPADHTATGGAGK